MFVHCVTKGACPGGEASGKDRPSRKRSGERPGTPRKNEKTRRRASPPGLLWVVCVTLCEKGRHGIRRPDPKASSTRRFRIKHFDSGGLFRDATVVMVANVCRREHFGSGGPLRGISSRPSDRQSPPKKRTDSGSRPRNSRREQDGERRRAPRRVSEGSGSQGASAETPGP